MADDWDIVFETFRPPFKARRHKESGNLYIEDQNGRIVCWIYPKGADAMNHKKPSEQEALSIARAIVKTSKRKK